MGPADSDPRGEHAGIAPRAISWVFDKIAAMDESHDFTLCISIVEIYCERLRDLLDPARDLTIKEDPVAGVYIGGVDRRNIVSAEQAFEVLQQGMASRTVSATAMNAESSRSHCICTVYMEHKNLQTMSTARGMLHIVDLAGSERADKTGAKGQAMKEAQKINTSLSALGLVINALTDPRGAPHIPYRNSKLTRVLQESLGGNARAVLLIAASPAAWNREETLSSLRFGKRAKRMRNKPAANVQKSAAELAVLLDLSQAEVARLEAELAAALRGKGGPGAAGSGTPGLSAEQVQEQVREREDMAAERAVLKSKVDKWHQAADALTAAASAHHEALKLQAPLALQLPLVQPTGSAFDLSSAASEGGSSMEMDQLDAVSSPTHARTPAPAVPVLAAAADARGPLEAACDADDLDPSIQAMLRAALHMAHSHAVTAARAVVLQGRCDALEEQCGHAHDDVEAARTAAAVAQQELAAEKAACAVLRSRLDEYSEAAAAAVEAMGGDASATGEPANAVAVLKAEVIAAKAELEAERKKCATASDVAGALRMKLAAARAEQSKAEREQQAAANSAANIAGAVATHLRDLYEQMGPYRRAAHSTAPDAELHASFPAWLHEPDTRPPAKVLQAVRDASSAVLSVVASLRDECNNTHELLLDRIKHAVSLEEALDKQQTELLQLTSNLDRDTLVIMHENAGLRGALAQSNADIIKLRRQLQVAQTKLMQLNSGAGTDPAGSALVVERKLSTDEGESLPRSAMRSIRGGAASIFASVRGGLGQTS